MWRRRNIACCALATLLATPTLGAPDAQEAIAAYRTARAGVDALQAPPPAGVKAPGAAITVRVSGRVAGYASVYEPGGGAFDAALRSAIGDFLQTDLVPHDATRRQRLADLARIALVHVELADELIPVSGATFAETGLAFSPGLDGAAARAGDQTRAVFPERMLSTHTTPAQALTAACAALGMEAEPLDALRSQSGVRVFRFRTQSIGQIDPGGPPTFFHRGGHVQPLTKVVGRRLDEFAMALGGSILSRVWTQDGETRLLGTYDPVRDEYDPLVAPLEEHALAALALARWGKDDASARTLLARIAPSDLDTRTAAIALLALDELDTDPGDFHERCVSALADAESRESLSERALAAAALAARDPERARELARGVLAKGGRGGVVSAAPWIVWAVRDLEQDGDVLGAPALREARDVMWRHRVTRADAGSDEADLVGGIVFTTSRQPLPTAQSARAAAMGAAMLTVPALTPEHERPAQLAALLPTLRFMRQLGVWFEEARLFPNPERAYGGVRLALWDHRQPVEATAMTLIAVMDTLEAAR